jgi:PKD repeat protein/glucose/arabinose dehydrogenase
MRAWAGTRTEVSQSGRRGTRAISAMLVTAAAFACSLAGPTPAGATVLPPGFQETTAISGLQSPTVVRFAPNGRVYVAEKRGFIKTYDSLSDTTPTTFADFRPQVYNMWDRGLLGMALDFNYSASPWVYVSYTHDAAIGGTAPRWNDACPDPPGPTTDGCVVSGRISKLKSTTGEVMSTQEVMIEDWCQQYPSHSMSQLEFDRTGALWGGGGEGASWSRVDWGQDGSPVNPCNDPGGSNPTPPTAEGGALRSQDLRTPASASDPTGLNGSVIRIDPSTGQGTSNNPLAGSSSANERRIVATGLRNPFRFALPQHLNEIYVGDVGWNNWEEIDRFGLDSGLVNFGWPCYEGVGRQSGYDNANLNLCENLYAQSSAVTSPFFTYKHSDKVVPSDNCPTGSSAISGLEFYYTPGFPAQYNKALFFSDHARKCIWVMRAGADGRPDPSTLQPFATAAANPVQVEQGPDGALYYPDFGGGRIMRIAYVGANQAPGAVATANPDNGPAPLTVDFDGGGSSDPDGDPITYAWDLDGDGQYDDSNAVSPTHTYNAEGNYSASLKVTDDKGLTGTASVPITVGSGGANTKPDATITSPTASQTWRVGTRFDFAGAATDPQQGSLPPSALDWDLIIHHCPSNCHEHEVQSWEGTDGGNPEDHFFAPDHDYPSHLELRLTATDSGGLTGTDSVLLNPRTVSLTLTTPQETGLSLTLNGVTKRRPFVSTVIEGSTNTISAPTPQVSATNGATYDWKNWLHGGPNTQTVTVNTSTTYTAQFAKRLGGNQAPRAVATANPQSGPAPLTVSFNGSGSSDPDGNPITYAWDLDGDFQFDDSTAVSPTYTYTAAGSYPASLKVTDSGGLTSTASVPITVGSTGTNTKPDATITSPTADQTWRVGTRFDFAGAATDPQDGGLPATALDWELILHHCPSSCHTHALQSWTDTDGGNSGDHFFGPDHGYPSHLELRLTATDSGGLTDTETVELNPRTVPLTLTTPLDTGLSLTLNGVTQRRPFVSTVIEGSTNIISAPSPQVSATNGGTYDWIKWEHGGPQTQTVTVNAATTYTAQFAKRR